MNTVEKSGVCVRGLTSPKIGGTTRSIAQARLFRVSMR